MVVATLPATVGNRKSRYIWCGGTHPCSLTSQLHSHRSLSGRGPTICLGGMSANAGIDESGQLLLNAVLEGAVVPLRKRLAMGDPCDKQDEDGRTPLWWACAGSLNLQACADCAAVLLNGHTMVDLADKDGNTPLLMSCIAGCVDTIELLIGAGAAVDLAKPEGTVNASSTALMTCCLYGHAPCARALLRARAAVDNATPQGATALMLAAQYGHPRCIDALLEAGATVNLATKHNALGQAAYRGHASCVQALLAAGAHQAAPNPDQETPLSMGCMQGHVRCVELLLDHSLEYLETPSNDARMPGFTPLIQAAWKGHSACVAALLAAGADPDLCSLPNSFGATETALTVGCFNGHPICVELLLVAGATPDLYVPDGAASVTALYSCCHVVPESDGMRRSLQRKIARCARMVECAQLLSSYGANRKRVIYVGSEQRGAAQVAAQNERVELVDWLDASREWTFLHHVELLSAQRTRNLLRNGADPFVRTSAGVSPIDRAHQLTQFPAAPLIVLASGPWSPHSHNLFPDAARKHAELALRSLYHIYRCHMSGGGGWQAIDFAHCVLALTITRKTTGLSLRLLCSR